MSTQRTGSVDEKMRLKALDDYHILDTGPESQFDDIAALAASICETPMAAITLVDKERQWFKSRIGLGLSETARDIAFCSHTIQHGDLFIVNDAQTDPRFTDNPLVIDTPHIRAYAGAPLVNKDGYAVGSLAVLDHRARGFTEEQKQALRILAREVVVQFDLRRALQSLHSAIAERDRAVEQLQFSHGELERRVVERTFALHRANTTLQDAYDERTREANLSQAIIDSVPGVFYVFDQHGRFLRWNRNFEKVAEYSHDEMARAHPLSFFSDEEKPAVDATIRKVLKEGKAAIEADLMTRSGKRIPHLFTGERILLDDKPCVAGMGVDITERRQAEEAMRLRDRAIQASVNAIIITDLEGNIEFANPAFERITGYSNQEVQGRNCRFLQREDKDQSGVVALRNAIRAREEGNALLRNYRKDGELFWNDVHIAPVRGPNGAVSHFVGVLNDITNLKNFEEQLERQANFDSLTALVNRNVLKDRIRQAIAGAQRQGSSVAVGFMDLDNFKFINDSLGHNIGDELLKSVAERLVACIRGQDTIARYGGDEFAFVLTGQKDEGQVAVLMERILKTIDRPFNIERHKLFVSCSIGLSFYPRDGHDAETLLKNADIAMHRAKDRGRNNVQFYTVAMNRRVTERLSLESRMRQALENGEFSVHYQPKVDLRSGEIVGAEALLRWQDLNGEIVHPSTFIPLAEETGLIVPIGNWVLHTACAHNKILQDANLPPLRVAVNISARQFEPHSICTKVDAALATSGLSATCLDLELTESLVMQNPEEVIKVLRDLKEMGVHLSIDDFGTGYSSLSYLQRLPVDHLKIDQSFVRDIGADPNDAIIARAVISLGHSLGMSVIAEGVSSQEQLAFLRENGCDEMQGFLFSRAVPFEEMMMMLRQKRVLELQ